MALTKNAPHLLRGRHPSRYVAAHEAGHAVAAVITNYPFRYVSLRPQNPLAAGHLMPYAQDERRPQWLPDLLVSAAGMVAEDFLRGGHDRRVTVAGGGSDLRDLQNKARYAWHRTHPDDDHDYRLDPAIDPDWTVLDIATHAWRQAYAVLWQHSTALWLIAEALEKSPRALTGTEVRRLVAEGDADDGELCAEFGPDEMLAGWLSSLDRVEFWPRNHSRLAWRTCGVVTTGV